VREVLARRRPLCWILLGLILLGFARLIQACGSRFVREVLAGRRPLSWILLGLILLGLFLALLLLLLLLRRGGGPPRYVLWEQSSGGIHADTPTLVSVPQDAFFQAKNSRSLCSYNGELTITARPARVTAACAQCVCVCGGGGCPRAFFLPIRTAFSSGVRSAQPTLRSLQMPPHCPLSLPQYFPWAFLYATTKVFLLGAFTLPVP
jgi:hypothetical protein